MNVFIFVFASEYCLLNGQHVYVIPFKMTNEHTRTHHRHSVGQKDIALCLCVWTKSRKYWFVLDENYAMRPPVTIHKTHKHAIILRLCNLCGSILYIRKHKIATAKKPSISRPIARLNFGCGSFWCQWFCAPNWYRGNCKNRLAIAVLFALTLSDRYASENVLTNIIEHGPAHFAIKINVK